ncbi:unnamed protein product, partial [Ectocarpus sp. 4 AP-2014]
QVGNSTHCGPKSVSGVRPANVPRSHGNELQGVGASQYCQRELRDEVDGSTPYDVKTIASAPAAADGYGYPLPLDGRSLRVAVESCTRGINAFEEAPANTDLD